MIGWVTTELGRVCHAVDPVRWEGKRYVRTNCGRFMPRIALVDAPANMRRCRGCLDFELASTSGKRQARKFP